MSSIWVLLILFIIMRVLAANSKEKAEQATRRAQQAAQEEAELDVAPPPQPRPAMPQNLEDIFPTLPPQRKAAAPRRMKAEDIRFPEPAAAPPPPPLPRQEGRGYGPSMGARPPEGSAPSGSMQTRPTEGKGLGRSMQVAPTEGRSFGGSMPVPGAKTEPSAPRHTVKPLTESAHSHRESSIGGIEDCAGDAAAIAAAEAAAAGQAQPTADAPRFPFDRTSLRQGFLYGELLGPPKALRR